MNSANKYNIYSFLKKINIYVLLVCSLSVLSNRTYSQEIDPNGYNTFYYTDGRVASEGMFKSGKPHGVWKSYYPNSVLKSIGEKQIGLSEGVWKFYADDGHQTHEYDYVADKKNGCAREFDSLGNVIKELFYVDNVLSGDVQEFYPTGELKKQLTYEDGKEVGVAYEFSKEGEVITEEVYEDGFLKERDEFNRYDENGKKTGKWREFYPNGVLKSEVQFKDGEMNGLKKEYNKKGKLVDISKMIDDSVSTNSDDIVLIELYKEYYPSGKVRLVGGISNGLKSGIYREYSQEGELVNGYIYEKDTMIAEGFVRFDGNYEGEWKQYYKTGKIKATGTYEDGVKSGKWVYYFANGKKEQEGTFKNNVLSGQWIWYFQNGQTRRIEYYNTKGNLEGMVTEWDSLGNELAHGEYFDGNQEGEWFYHVGDFKEVGAFTIGLQNGVWRHYYKNGKLAFIGTYDEGEPKGKHTYYHDNGIRKKQGKFSGGEKHGIWKSFNERGEEIETIHYKHGEIFKINGFKVPTLEEE